MYEPTQNVRNARTLLNHCFREIRREDLRDDGLVVGSELVTNALRYSPACWLYVEIRRDRDVLIGVWDSSMKQPEMHRRAVPDSLNDKDGIVAMEESGRGLLVVSQLSKAWGWDYVEPTGKVVWAILGSPDDPVTD